MNDASRQIQFNSNCSQTSFNTISRQDNKKSDYGITMQEREDCKNLVTDAKKQEEEDSLGEFIYRVRGVSEKFAVVKLHKPVRRQ